MKNRTTAGLLAILLGGIGIHRFYLRQTGLGILYVIFFWTFIPAIVALIDGILFLTWTEEKFNEKYNKGIQMPNSVVNVADELTKLNDLKVQGIITEEEFKSQKERLLNN